MTANHRPPRVAVVPGDGIGPEVTNACLDVLDALQFEHELVMFDLGTDLYLRTGEALSAGTLEQLREFDAILFGALGDARAPVGLVERQVLLRLRTSFDLCVNLRPVRLLPGVRSTLAERTSDDIDMVIVRENVEGLYGGAGGAHRPGTIDEVATQESINTWTGVSRVVEFAFSLAEDRRRHVTMVHKANALQYAGGLWSRVLDETARRHPAVTHSYLHVDAAAMFMVTDPRRFDVVVTENLFGDILSDIGAGIAGGMGLAASANLNLGGDAPSLFEPVHGSAPDIAGRGVANPIAAIRSLALLLTHLGQAELGAIVDDAVAAAALHGALEGGTNPTTASITAAVVEGIVAGAGAR